MALALAQEQEQEQEQEHRYENWRHTSIISRVGLVDKNGKPLDVNDDRYSAFGGYVSSRPTRLIASTIPSKDDAGRDCVVVGINSRWNEKVAELYGDISFEGAGSDPGTCIRSYGSGIFPVEGWLYRDVSVQKDRELDPQEITSHIHFQHETTGEEVSVFWDWV